MEFLLAAKEKIAANFNNLPFSFEDAELSKLIFRGTLDEHHSDVINAHIKACPLPTIFLHLKTVNYA